MRFNMLTQVVGFVNHVWLSVLNEEQRRNSVGIRYIGHGWDDDPYWLFWLRNKPGVYRLELKEAVSDREFDWIANFTVKYFPSRTEPAFLGLSALEKLCRDSDVFDNNPTNTGGGCPCHGTDRDQSESRFQDLGGESGVPVTEIAVELPPDFFFAGHLSIAHRSDAGAVITAKTQDFWRVRMSEDYVIAAADGTTAVRLEKGSIDRNYPGKEITLPLYELFIDGWSCFLDAGKRIERRWEGDGYIFRSDGVGLNPEPSAEIRKIVLQTTIESRAGINLTPPLDSDMKEMEMKHGERSADP